MPRLAQVYDGMKKNLINLAKRKDAKVILPYVVLVAFILLAAAWSWRSVNVYRQNIFTHEFYNAKLARTAKAAKVSPSKASLSTNAAVGAESTKRLKKEAEFINNIIMRETYSWTRLLMSLEKSASDNIVVTQISPDFDKKTVMVSGMAKSIDDCLLMIDRMGSSDIFTNVFLLKHSGNPDKKSALPNDIVLFTLSATYSAQDRI